MEPRRYKGIVTVTCVLKHIEIELPDYKDTEENREEAFCNVARLYDIMDADEVFFKVTNIEQKDIP